MQLTDFYIENNVVIIARGVKVIQTGMLPNRTFSCIHIPSSVEQILPNAISCDVIYDGIFISKEEIMTYGCENIPRIATFIKYRLNYKDMPKEVFELLPLTNDAIKGYQANHSYYHQLHESINPGNNDIFFKLCYTIGLFTVPPKTRVEVEQAITYLYREQAISNDSLNHLVLQDIDLTFIQLVLGLFRNHHLLEFMPYYVRMYNDCKQICKIIKKIKEQKIYDKRKELDRDFLPSEYAYAAQLLQELERLEDNRKTISFQDIRNYFLHHTFVIRDGNEALEMIMPIIKQHISSQRDFNILQDIYEEAKSVKKEASKIFTALEGKSGEFTYRWLENDDYENLILGYLTDCCAKLGGAGEGIIKVSMTHPQVRTLVVYDSFQRIIGKSTIFYSLEGKYLLGNTIEVAHSFIKSPKTTEEQKKALLQTFLEGLQAQVMAMDKLGYMVNQVRIGMRKNNLEEPLQQYPIEKENLLPNIPYGSYLGDASSPEVGQVILPIGKEGIR